MVTFHSKLARMQVAKESRMQSKANRHIDVEFSADCRGFDKRCRSRLCETVNAKDLAHAQCGA